MMAHASEPVSREDHFVQKHSRLLLADAGAFGLWQLAEMMGETDGRRSTVIYRALSLAAWAGWTASLILILRNGRLMNRDPALRAAFRDERARDARLRAYRAGYWATIGSAALLGIPAAAHLLPSYAALRLVVVAGVVVFIASFVLLSRE